VALLDIVLYPEEVLSTPGKDVDEVGDDIRALLDDLAETMYAARGVGLAANQIGDLRRVCVIDTRLDAEEEDGPGTLIELVNPRVVEREGELVWEEGCLSVPEIFEDVKRAAWVRVEALDRDGNEFSIEGEELLAVVLQHEIDHLDGVMFLDHISRLKRRMALKRFKKVIETRAAKAAEQAEGSA
jgi:peptide deformylase